MTKAKNPWRLSRDVEPVSYHLTLTPDFANFTFAGEEAVTIHIKQPTKKITLHALDLKISKTDLCYVGQVGHAPARRITFNKKFETVTLDFGETLKPGEAVLHINFEGELNDKMHGFYRTSYNIGGKTRWGAATQFEATDARRCFPCWDEPDMKAVFNVDLVIPQGYTALSNMPASTEETADDLVHVVYRPTPKMSTYLLAFVVAELEHIEAPGPRGIPVRVWTTSGKQEQGRFALDVAQFTLDYFERWFGIPYPLPKLDMVALPDFAAGAMENWGLVTYRETALLIDPVKSSASAKQLVAKVVGHELAHMWFGDWTTMEWWTHLWLNEGYASYMGPKANALQFPEWDIWTQYVAGDYLAALHEDSLRSTHAVEIEVRNPAEIREVFDTISYSKGSVVNRMLEHFLSEGAYRRGLNRYLRRYALGNATTNDLWRELGSSSGKPVETIMASYTRQPGYPVLTVERHNKKNNGKTEFRLSQRRFLVDGGKDTAGLLWKIPVGMLTPEMKEPAYVYMKGRRMMMRGDSSAAWVKFNPGQSGFYRVAYPPDMLAALRAPVLSKELPVVDRLGLLDDTFALARAGQIKTRDALYLLSVYRHEDDFSVWTRIVGVLGGLDSLLVGDTGSLRDLHGFASRLLRSIVAEKGWDKKPDDGHLDVMLRALTLRAIAGFGDKTTIEEASTRFSDYAQTGKLDPDLRQMVCTIIAENDKNGSDYNALMRIYDSTDFSEEKVRILRALGALTNKELINEALGFAMNEKKVRRQDAPILLATMGMNTAARPFVWEFVKTNWDELKRRYHGGGFGIVTRVFKTTVSGFTTREWLKDAEGFFRAHRVPGSERAIKQALEAIRSNIAWLKRDHEEIADWLNRNNAS
ncbi:MAG: M1 family metallopeptidase [Candidatus Sungbacteria bacterium]|nr:M1 family metallopeptidase [Candidatus Sungbacteria bacterium]